MTELTLSELADRQLRKSADAREQNRRDFPECARLVDMLNAAELGPVKVIFAEENGRTIGCEETGWAIWPKSESDVPRGAKVEKYKRSE